MFWKVVHKPSSSEFIWLAVFSYGNSKDEIVQISVRFETQSKPYFGISISTVS
jgi:hypothetical protein